MDELHTITDGHVVAKTCIHCGSTLVMSDYGMIVCTRCEEPQVLFEGQPDERINKDGLKELFCYQCRQWKVFAGGIHDNNWAWFPEKDHECRSCYDKSYGMS